MPETEQERLAAIDAEIRRRTEALSRLEEARLEGQDVEGLSRQIGEQQFGITRRSDIGSEDERRDIMRRLGEAGYSGMEGVLAGATTREDILGRLMGQRTGLFGLGGTVGEDVNKVADLKRILFGTHDVVLTAADLEGKLRGELDPLARRRGFQGERAIGELLGNVKQQEAEALGTLKGSQQQYLSAIDEQLKGLLGDIGIQAGEARGMVGEQLAGRGLLRSSFGTRQLGAVTGAELQQKAEARAGALQQKRSATEAVSATERQIQQRRRQLELNRSLGELQSFRDVGFQLNVEDIQNAFDREVMGLQLKAQQSRAMGGILSGLLTAVGAVVGSLAGPAGTAAGAALGGAAGSAISGSGR